VLEDNGNDRAARIGKFIHCPRHRTEVLGARPGGPASRASIGQLGRIAYVVTTRQWDDRVKGQLSPDEFNDSRTDADARVSAANWCQIVYQSVVSPPSIEAGFQVICDVLAQLADSLGVGGGRVDFSHHFLLRHVQLISYCANQVPRSAADTSTAGRAIDGLERLDIVSFRLPGSYALVQAGGA
jgi:hypothetical protein